MPTSTGARSSQRHVVHTESIQVLLIGPEYRLDVSVNSEAPRETVEICAKRSINLDLAQRIQHQDSQLRYQPPVLRQIPYPSSHSYNPRTKWDGDVGESSAVSPTKRCVHKSVFGREVTDLDGIHEGPVAYPDIGDLLHFTRIVLDVNKLGASYSSIHSVGSLTRAITPLCPVEKSCCQHLMLQMQRIRGVPGTYHVVVQ